MKKASILFIVVFALAVCVTSCSKCYDCTYEIEVETPTGIVIDTVTEDYCTASKQELDDKEADGYTCSDQ